MGQAIYGSLTGDQVEFYRNNGFLSALQAFSPDEAQALRAEIEGLERHHSAGAAGHDLNQFFRVNGHITIPTLANIARTPAILDAVSGILGDDLLVWSVEVFTKEAGTTKVVSWHQDITYWGMNETDEELTAWIALSDVSVEAGCMRFIPGSQANPILPHADTFHEDNLLSRGQEIPDIDESQAVHGPLKAGQMSFHHGRTFHASGPNRSGDRRIGIAIRYVTPAVKADAVVRDYAMVVRGKNTEPGWIVVASPTGLFDPHALALYDEILQSQAAILSNGAETAVGMYQTGKEMNHGAG